MKLFVKLMLLVVVLALAGPFFIKGTDGQPLMTVSDVKRSATEFVARTKQEFHDAKTKTQRSLGDENAGKTAVHRWQDENGEWHYSDAAPAGTSEVVHIEPNVTKMQTPKPSETPLQPSSSESAPATSSALPPAVITPGRVKEAIGKTKDVRNQIEERQQEIDKRITDN